MVTVAILQIKNVILVPLAEGHTVSHVDTVAGTPTIGIFEGAEDAGLLLLLPVDLLSGNGCVG
jgi:hypothetical protein